jgi:hypothetical protein
VGHPPNTMTQDVLGCASAMYVLHVGLLVVFVVIAVIVGVLVEEAEGRDEGLARFSCRCLLGSKKV